MLARGFTLIEVLVTLVILMFGLLGIAGLMAKGQKASYEAYQRQQALALASDMTERIRSNPNQAAAYASAAPTTAPVGTLGSRYSALVSGALTPNCSTSSCTAAQLAAYDVALWEGLLQGYGERNAGGLIGGAVGARGCVESPATNPALVTTFLACQPVGTTPRLWFNTTYRVSVAWQGNEKLGTVGVVGYPTCGTGLYGVEADGYRRVVALDVLLSTVCPP